MLFQRLKILTCFRCHTQPVHPAERRSHKHREARQKLKLLLPTPPQLLSELSRSMCKHGIQQVHHALQMSLSPPAKGNYEIRTEKLQGLGPLPRACPQPCLPPALQLPEVGDLTMADAVLHPLPQFPLERCSLLQKVRGNQGMKIAGKVVMFANCSVQLKLPTEDCLAAILQANRSG